MNDTGPAAPMSTTAKFSGMHDALDTPIEQIIAAIDNGAATSEGTPAGFTPALFAGLSAAKVLLSATQYGALAMRDRGHGDGPPEAAWQLFRSRLQFALHALTNVQDSGQPTQFGLWDGLHFAAVEARRIDTAATAGPTAGLGATTSGAAGTAAPPAGDEVPGA